MLVSAPDSTGSVTALAFHLVDIDGDAFYDYLTRLLDSRTL